MGYGDLETGQSILILIHHNWLTFSVTLSMGQDLVFWAVTEHIYSTCQPETGGDVQIIFCCLPKDSQTVYV